MSTPDNGERAAFVEAQELAAELVRDLAVLPREVSVRQEIGYGVACSVRLFCAGDRRPVDALAARLGQPVTREASASGSGMYYEVRAQIDGISVHATALLKPGDGDGGVLHLGTAPCEPTTGQPEAVQSSAAVTAAGADA